MAKLELIYLRLSFHGANALASDGADTTKSGDNNAKSHQKT